MAIDELPSEWFWRISKKCYKKASDHSLLIRENKDMLIEKWADLYFKKYKTHKYKFENKTKLIEFLDNKINWYCDHLEDNKLKDLKTLKEGETLLDYDKIKKIREFARDFHEMLYDLSDHDPRILTIENEKKKHSKTKEMKNKFVARLIGLLKRKR